MPLRHVVFEITAEGNTATFNFQFKTYLPGDHLAVEWAVEFSTFDSSAKPPETSIEKRSRKMISLAKGHTIIFNF